MLQRHCDMCGEEIPPRAVFLLARLLAVVADADEEISENGQCFEVCSACINAEDGDEKLFPSTAIDLLTEWHALHPPKEPADG